MPISRRELLKTAGATGLLGAVPVLSFAQDAASMPEKKALTIAVGGQPLIYYLPLSVAHLKGYFKDEVLDVTIADFAGGSKALQAVVDEHGVNYLAAICAICKSQFTKVLPYYKHPMDMIGSVHGLVSNAIVFNRR